MNPKIWGPYLWTSLLYIVLSYPDSPSIDVKHDYRQFFLTLGRVLPCVDCRKNYCDHLKVIPIDNYLDGRSALLDWLWRVHNQINDFCGKPRLTVDEFLKKYVRLGDRNSLPQLANQLGGSGIADSRKIHGVYAGSLSGSRVNAGSFPVKTEPAFRKSYVLVLLLCVVVLFALCRTK